MAFAKLNNLMKTELYVRPENMEHNVGYPVRKLTITTNRFNASKSSILCDLSLSDTVSGAYYLPFKYTDHPVNKLSARDVDEINKAITKKAKTMYIVHKGITMGQAVIDLMHVNVGERFAFKIYEGLDAEQKVARKGKSDSNDHEETAESESQQSKKMRLQ